MKKDKINMNSFVTHGQSSVFQSYVLPPKLWILRVISPLLVKGSKSKPLLPRHNFCDTARRGSRNLR